MKESERPPWAQLIADLRGTADLSQKVLAESAGISVGHIGMIETGNRIPSPESLERIADALGLTAKQRAHLLAAVPRDERPLSIPERLSRLEEVVAELAARLDDGKAP